MRSVAEINVPDDELAQALILPLIERSPDIANRVAARRPFECATKLAEAIQSELIALKGDQLIRLFLAHPELAPDNPLAMTEESQSEQRRLNLTDAANGDQTRMSEMNAAYREKFGFPFITALFRHENMESVMAEFESRLAGNKSTEIKTALSEIIAIMRSRVELTFGNHGDEKP